MHTKSRRLIQARHIRTPGACTSVTTTSPVTLAEAPVQGARTQCASQAPQTHDPAATPVEAQRAPLRNRARELVKGITAIGVVAIYGAMLPAKAGAYATIGPEPEPGSPGLPDGRVYAQVSPQNKSGSEAGGLIDKLASPVMLAGNDGDSVLYSDDGPIGNSATGVQDWTVARHVGAIWENDGLLPPAPGVPQTFRTTYPRQFALSADLSKVLFIPPADGPPYVSGETAFGNHAPGEDAAELFVHAIGAETTTWLGAPAITNALPAPLETIQNSPFYNDSTGAMAGASADLSTVYFDFAGTLTPADSEPNASLGDISRTQVLTTSPEPAGDSGFYEWHEGTLTSAGVLPNGSLDPYGAVSAATPTNSASFTGASLDNQVSESGNAAFFVSPAPESGSGRPSELYVRETGPSGAQRTVLVSRDTLLPDEVEGLPAPAPTGPIGIQSSLRPGKHAPSYVYASRDGERAFFTSTDALTRDAPTDTSGKFYEFNLNTETLTYLPGITPPTEEAGSPSTAQIVASTADGSRFFFEKLVGREQDKEQLPVEVDMYADGVITPIVALSGVPVEGISVARTDTDGSVLVFQTTDPLPGFNDGGTNAYGGTSEPNSEIFRYEAASNSLSCLSCARPDIAPHSEPRIDSSYFSKNLFEEEGTAFSGLGVSADGSRVFFDTSEALVPWDKDGTRDVYEWENGKLYLISSGASGEESFFGDNSSNGSDVFFSTAQGLNPGDTDGAYDVYDARVPRPEDTVPAATACEGEVCRGGPPPMPQLLESPASATFSGLGNPAPRPALTPATAKKATRKTVKCKKGTTLKHRRCVKRKVKKSSRKGRS